MAIYLLGDLQGCSQALERMLSHLHFSPSRDQLYVLGDLVNRGPDSVGVLRRLRDLEGSAHVLLGNHDLHALAVSCGARRAHTSDTLEGLLQAPDREGLLDWLRQQPLARQAHGVLMVHAGVLPGWDAATTLALAREVSDLLQGPQWHELMHGMYGNTPASWQSSLTGIERLRVIINALTRLRFCSAQGEMEFLTKEGVGHAPPGFMPWFEVPGRLTACETVAFGHWSTLGWLGRQDVLALDTGCVWGGCLTAVEIGNASEHPPSPIQIRCEAAQTPGRWH